MTSKKEVQKPSLTERVYNIYYNINYDLLYKTLFVVSAIVIFYVSLIRFQEPVINKIVGIALIVMGIITGFSILKEQQVYFIISSIAIIIAMSPLFEAVFSFIVESETIKEIFGNIYLFTSLYLTPAIIVAGLKKILKDNE